MVLEIFFLTLSKPNIWFIEQISIRKIYMTAKTLPTTKHIKITGKKKFAVAILDIDNKIFVMHITELTIMPIHFSRKVQVALLINIDIPIKYSGFLDIFF